jgi:hypothetical protein
LSSIRLQELKKTTKNLSQDSRSPGQDLNPVPYSYCILFILSDKSRPFDSPCHLAISTWKCVSETAVLLKTVTVQDKNKTLFLVVLDSAILMQEIFHPRETNPDDNPLVVGRNSF